MQSQESGGEREGDRTAEGTPAPSRGERTPRILLVDCDMFYVQVARLEDPEGAGREPLLIVGGSAEGRGVVTSASYEVRAYGVHSAMPTGQALRLCPDAVVVPVPRGACTRKSREVRSVLERLSPVVQAASIDEFYLDLTGTERLFEGESLEETAWRIREAVLDETRISVSVGGATARMVAKLAVGLAKPGGVRVVAPGQEAAFMRAFELSDIPGVGPALLESLEKRGLRTVEDALEVQESWLVEWLGDTRGRWLYARIRGIDPTPVSAETERKSISSETTFSRDLDEDRELEKILLRLGLSVGASLRRKGFRARTVTVKLRDADFTTRQSSHTLPEPVESDQTIYSVARNLLKELRSRRRIGARLVGVGVTNLVDRDEPAQLALFEEAGRAERERDRTLSRVADELRERFGKDAVLPGAILDRSDPKDGGDA